MALIAISGYAGSGKDTVGVIIQYLTCPVPVNATIEEIVSDVQNHQWWLEDTSGWEVKKWAGKLKAIASLLSGISVKNFEDQEFKTYNMNELWNCWYISQHDQRTKETLLHGPYKDKEEAKAERKSMETGLKKKGLLNDVTLNITERPMKVREFLQRLGTDACRNGLHTNTWVNALMADYKPTQVQWSDGPIGGYEDGPMPNWIITDTRFPNEAEAIQNAGGILIRVNRPGVEAINAHPSETSLDNWKFDHVIDNNGTLEDLVEKVKTILTKINVL